MAKNRLIFTLLLDHGTYQLSRNFSLQAAGDLNWLKDFYDFNSIALSIDELVVLNVDRGERDMQRFAQNVAELSQGCFMPMAAGGGIRSLKDAYLLLHSGADKLVVNTPVHRQPELVRELVEHFGSQCIVAAVDYLSEGGKTETFIENGQTPTGKDAVAAAKLAESLGAGEIYLNSIRRDGTGQGLELDITRRVAEAVSIPVIAAGGVGTFQHLVEGLRQGGATASATANLFNFMAKGLTEARQHMLTQGVSLARWDTEKLL